MSLSLAVLNVWNDGRAIHVIGRVTASGNYAAGGDTLSFKKPEVKTNKVPALVHVVGRSDMSYKYIPGASRDVGKITVRGTGGIVATGTITSDTTNTFSDGEVIVLGSKTYTLKTALSTGPTVPYEVKIGVSITATLDNIKAAVNAAAGVGTTYSTGTVANPDIVAGTKTSTTIVFNARVSGTAGNSLASTTDAAHLSFGATTLGSGTNNAGGADEIAASGYPQGVIDDNILIEAIFL